MITQIIENLKSIPKLEKNKELFFREYHKLGKIGIIEYYFHSGKYLFRSRINENETSYTSKDKISYPPFPSKDFGRANLPGKNMFYGSFIPTQTNNEEIKEAYIINAYEISPFLRDKKAKGERKITIGMWRVKCDIRLVVIPFYTDYINKTALSKNLNLGFNVNLTENIEYKESTEIWNKFISQEFAKPIDNNNNSEYMISATYSEFLLNNGFDGIIYPTVQLDGRGFNFSIKTQIVDKCLDVEIVGEARFYKNELKTLLDWEKKCVVKDPFLFQFEEDEEKIGKEMALKIINQ